MSDANVPETVGSSETLARFILFSKWLRADQTVKPDAFIPRPPPHLDLSMFRHIGLAESQLWQIGRSIAEARTLTLYGRADVSAAAFLKHSLRILPTPPQNHANITTWPADKPSQKIIALEIAAIAVFHSNPDTEAAAKSPT